MTKQELAVLKHLRLFGRDTDSNIGLSIGAPPASVRRVIQQLMRKGEPISYAGSDGTYVLLSSPAQIAGGGR